MDINLSQLQEVKNRLYELPHDLYWQIPKDGAEYLYNAVLRLNPKLILEIGTSSGYSALWLVEALLALNPKTTSRLITIESHAERFQLASEHFKQAKVESLIQNVKGHAPEIFESVDLSVPVNLAFFDGTKAQTTDFFKAIWPLLSANGEILVDNVVSHHDKMQPFFDYLKANNINYEIIDLGAGICRIVKN